MCFIDKVISELWVPVFNLVCKTNHIWQVLHISENQLVCKNTILANQAKII